ncbi:TIR-like protein FxsC [Streptomyces sp. Tu102]|uniref:TIR-like protein FxsC n=1 Tax=Streptomyces sp. Tu102 TaxID=2838019 RepID=UPI001BDBB571|nr:TIR-like protein FxsC [Streptomyces sp. Tu102]MBT1090610.1 TIR domain-containing protein [Streptomyces sp. Tu102]
MELTEATGEDPTAPYFFLSYARIPRTRPDDPDPDLWVHRLFHDLCEHIRNLTAHPGAPGFMDRAMQAGQIWSDELAESLGGCRVFVPLYSPRYFISPWCGKEWGAFTERRARHREQDERGTPSAIVPALWSPVPDRRLPDCVREVQYTHPELGDRYRTFGLYGLAKLRSFRSDYQKAVLRLAMRIVDVGESVVLERGARGGLSTAHDAFGAPPAGAPPSGRRLRISIAAGCLDELPEGRSPHYYGPTPLDWNPYRPASDRPLAEVAAGIAARLDFRPDVAEFDHTSAPADAPEVLLLDRWVLRDPQQRARLREFDGNDRPPTGLVVPWNDDDPDGDDTEHELAAQVDATLPRRVRQAREASRPAVRGVPDERSFQEVLPRVVHWAEGQFLRRARPRTSSGQVTPRFRLGAPDGPNSYVGEHRPGAEKEDQNERA